MRPGFLALMLLLWAAAVLPAQPPPPRPFDRNAPADLLRLQEAELDVQRQILALQDELLASAKQGKPPRPGDPRLEKMGRLNDRLRLMAGQERRLARSLPPPHLMPPGVMQQLERTRDEIGQNMGQIKGGFEQLRGKMPEGGEKLPRPPEPGDSAPRPVRTLPSTEQDAGKSINSGEVQSPRSLIETFMQLPDKKLPKSNLDYYRKLRR